MLRTNCLNCECLAVKSYVIITKTKFLKANLIIKKYIYV
jgi:hypothetical protein